MDADIARPPDITCVIPTRDRPELLQHAIDSVLEQRSATEIRVIVVDDGSTYPVAADDDRVQVVRREPGVGPAAARNIGVEHADTELVAFLDDDDVWLPGKVETTVGALRRHPDVDVVAHKTGFSLPSAAESGQTTVIDRPIRRFLLAQPPHLDGIVVRREVHLRSPFDPTFAAAEDLDYLFRLAERNRFAFVDQTLARFGDADRKPSVIGLDRRIAARLQLRERHQHLFDAPADAFHLVRLGHLYRRAGQRRRAAATFARAIWKSPRLGLAWRGAGLAVMPKAASDLLVSKSRS